MEEIMSENSQDLECLAGIRVVDFTQFEAGTSCTEALAWLGAEVVKVENPKTGDPGRRLRPGKPDDDPWYFHMFNANKKSLAIDLKSPRGLALVKAMLAKADVTVENMAPGTIERLGLGYDEVKKINPRIIFCSIQGFGTGLLFSPLSTLAYASLDPVHRVEGTIVSTMMRSIGSSVGISVVQALVLRNAASAHSLLGGRIDPSDPLLINLLPRLMDMRTMTGLTVLNGEVTRQSAMLGYVNIFMWMALGTCILLPLVAILRPAPAIMRSPTDTAHAD